MTRRTRARGTTAERLVNRLLAGIEEGEPVANQRDCRQTGCHARTKSATGYCGPHRPVPPVYRAAGDMISIDGNVYTPGQALAMAERIAEVLA